MDKEKIKKYINIENLLYAFLILCPILDVSSFLFRNHFNTSLSISTFVRPIIPIIAIIYIFFKGKKTKLGLIIAGVTYGLYALIHLYIFNQIVTTCAYGNAIRELQYLVNYTFMVMNLFIYLYIFVFTKANDKESRNNNIKKLRKVILITFTIYIALMYIAILTGTSSFTYKEDQMGYKGWFESGNSVGAIMILSLFIVMPMMTDITNSIKIRILALVDTILSGIYLSTILGTRVGLFGFLIVVFIYVICEILYKAFHNKKVNKKIITLGTGIFVVLTIAVISFGSITITRRKLLQSREDDIYDANLGESSHVTGDILKIVDEINNKTIDNNFMSKPMQKSIIDLYNYNNKHEVSNTNMRMIQMVYHTALIKNQKSLILDLFGNGYMTHFYELIFEMEVPAFLYNFGIFGFTLYFMPFLIIAIYGICQFIKNIRKIRIENIMETVALCFAIMVSFLSGYTFFNSSTTMIIIAICTMIINNIINMKGETNWKK